MGVDLFATKGFQTVSIGPSYGKSGFDVNAGYSRDLGGEVARDIRDFEQRIREEREAWGETKREMEDFADDLRIIKKGFDDYGEMSRTIINHNKEMIEDWKRVGRGFRRDGRQLKAAGNNLMAAGRDIGLAFKCVIRGCAPPEKQVRKRTKNRSW